MKRLFVILLVAGGLAGCSVLLDWNGYTGGGSDAGRADEGSGDDVNAGDDPGAPPACDHGGVCAPAAPSGWNGPVALYEAPGSGQRPACGSGYAGTPAFDGNAGLQAAPATCSACSCSAPAGGGCSDPVMTFWSDSGCTSQCETPARLSTSSCVTPPPCTSFTVGASTPTGATCAPAGGTTTLPPVSWSVVARACAPAAPVTGACAGGAMCLPDPRSTLAARLCVWQTGAAASCPTGYDAAPSGPRVYYGDAVTDTRGCSACGCGDPAGGSCYVGPPPPTPTSPRSPAGFRLLYGCGTAPTIPFFVPNDCTVLTTASFQLNIGPTLDKPGSCAPSGGQATGGVTPTDAATFCCLP